MLLRAAIIFTWAFVAASCSKQSSAPADKPAPAVHPSPHDKDPATAKQRIAQGVVVLDVRTPDEFETGHLPSATNIPVDEVGARIAEVDKLVGGDKSKPVVTYCERGGRAAQAKAALEAAGYTNVVNGGGLDDLE